VAYNDSYLFLESVKQGRKYLDYGVLRYHKYRVRLFKCVQLCDEGRKLYPFLCQNWKPGRREVPDVETTPHIDRNLRRTPIWHRLLKEVSAWWYEVKMWYRERE